MKKKHQQESPEAGAERGEPKGAAGSRRVYLFGRLENEVTLPIIRRLLRLNDRDPHAPIDLFINSSGGNGYNADAVIAVMHSLTAPVNTICLGHALSGACEILASGTGKRSAYEFATLMFHQTLWEADGDITNLEIQAAQGQRFRDAQIELLSRCTGQERTRIRRDIERDYYMSAGEALAYGIIDEVIKHGKRTSAAAGKAGKARNGADSGRQADVESKNSRKAGARTDQSRKASKVGRGKNG